MSDKIVDGFRLLSTAAVADVFRHMGYPQQVMDSTILPFKEGWSFCGRAFTQANLPARKGEDYTISKEAEQKWKPGDVIVESYWGAWGFNYALGAFLKGCAGAVIDGPYRDIPGHKQELPDFPVFCRRGLPDRSVNPGGSHRSHPTRWMYAYNVPINCAGVRVDPGDIVLGDDDGVVVIPAEVEQLVLKFASSYLEADKYVCKAKREGRDLEEAHRKLNNWAEESGLRRWLESSSARKKSTSPNPTCPNRRPTGRRAAAGATGNAEEEAMVFPEGVVTPVLTPFRSDLTVDVESATRHCSYLVSSGVSALFVLGSNGEGYDMDRGARRAMVGAAQSTGGRKVPVFVGCMGMGTSHIMRRVKDVEDLKPEAIVLMLPCYNILKSPREAKRHFLRLKDSTAYPIIIYNLPSVTGGSIDAGTVLELAEDEQFIGIKDTSGDARYLLTLLSRNPRPRSFGVLVGNPWLSAFGCLFGASGIVPSTANIDPEGSVQMLQAVKEGCQDRLRLLQGRMTGLRLITEEYGRELSMKQILVWKGLYNEARTSTGETMASEVQERLRSVARQYSNDERVVSGAPDS